MNPIKEQIQKIIQDQQVEVSASAAKLKIHPCFYYYFHRIFQQIIVIHSITFHILVKDCINVLFPE